MTNARSRPRGSLTRPSGPRALALLAGALILLAAPAAGQTADPVPQPGALDGLLRGLQLKAKPSTAPDFVRRSRPASSDYVPVGRTHPERPVKVMTPVEIEAETNALDADRVAQQRRAGVKPPPVPLKVPKSAPSATKTTSR